MTREPVNIEFVLKGDVEREIDKVKLSVETLGTEGASSYRRLLNASNEAFNSLSKDAQMQAVTMQKVIGEIRQAEEVQRSLQQKYQDGEISATQYAEASARLAVEQSELKAQAAGLSAQIEREIQQNRLIDGSYNQKVARLNELKEAYRNLSEEERNNADIGESMLTQIRQLDDETKKLSDTMNGASGANTGFIDSLRKAPGVVGSTVSGIEAMVKASLRFIATPLGAIIAAIVVALKALFSWFNRTEEGQNALAKASGYFKGILESLMDVVSKVGKWLYEAFTNPKKALQDLVQFLRDQVINRFEAVGKIGAAIAKIFTKDWKEGLLDLGNAALQFSTGIEDAGKKAAAFAQDVNEKAERRAAIQDKLFKLRIKERQINEEIAASEIKIAEAREKVYDTTLSEKERYEELQKATKLIEEKYRKQIELAKQRRDLVKEEKSLSDSTIEDNEEVSQLTVEISRLEAQRANEKRMLLRQMRTLNNSMERQEQELYSDTFRKELDIRKKEYQTYYSLIAATDKAYAKSRFSDLVAEGDSYLEYITRKIAELQGKTNLSPNESTQLAVYTAEKQDLTGSGSATDNLKREIEQRKKLYSDDILAFKQYLQEKKQALANDLSEEGYKQTVILDVELQSSEEGYQDKLNELLNNYGSYTTKLVSLTRDYQRDRKILEQAGTQEAKQALNNLTEEYNAAVLQLQAENEDFFKTLFGDLSKISIGALKEAISAAKAWMDQYKDEQGNWANDLSAEQKSLLIEVQKGVTDAEKEVETKIPDKIKSIAGGLEAAAEAASMFDGELGDIIATASDLASGMGDIAEGVANMASGNVVQGAMQAVSGIVKIIKTFKANIDYNKQVLADYKQLMLERNLAESEYLMMLRERLRVEQQIGETVLGYNQRITKELEKQKATNKTTYEDIWAQLMGEEYISATRYKHGTWIRKAKTVNEYASLMGKTYEDIEKLYESGVLTDASKALFEQLKALKEEGKDIDDMLQEQAEAMREAYTGTTTQSIIDSIVQGFESGYRSAADFADTFESLMKKAVMQSLQLQLLEEPIRQWYEAFASSMAAGTLEQDMAGLNASFNSIIDKSAAWLEAAEAATGLYFSGGTTQTADKNSIITVSEETATKLEGHFVAVRINTGRLVETAESILSVVAKQVLHLAAIERNTDELKRLEVIETVIKRIESNGIKLKS